MNYNLDLQLHTPNSKQPDSRPAETNSSDLSAFHTSFLTTRAQKSKERVKEKSAELNEIVKTPEFQCLVIAARSFANAEGISIEESTERLIDTFRKLDSAWKQIIMNQGLETLTQSVSNNFSKSLK